MTRPAARPVPRPVTRPVARWGLVTSGLAPVLLAGGWTVAAARQVAPFDPVTETISALAGLGATDRGIMTAALAGLGCCHVGTALALRPARLPGRAVLAAGGVATLLVAALPLDADGTSTRHGIVAATAFGALTVWPALAARRTSLGLPWGLRPLPAAAATVVLAGAVAWFAVELAGGPGVGLSERVTALAQAVWPLAVVVSGFRPRRQLPPPSPDHSQDHRPSERPSLARPSDDDHRGSGHGGQDRPPAVQ